MLIMDNYHSSDDEIAWGPLTLEEIKKEFQLPARKPKRRETNCGLSTPYFTPSTTFSDEKSEEMDGSQNKGLINIPADMDILNTSVAASAYFTPEESLAPPFISPSSSTELFLGNIITAVEVNNSPSNSAKETNTLTNDTLINILMREKNEEKNTLTKIEQTLIENRHSDMIYQIPTINEELFEGNSLSEVITISDDSIQEVEDLIQISVSSMKIGNKVKNEEWWESSKEYNSSSEENLSSSFQDDFDNVIDENTEKVNCLDLKDNTIDSKNTKITDVENSLHCSVESNENYSLEFNDTMEEMELALKEGLDYVMPNDTHLNSQNSVSNSQYSMKTGIPKLKRPQHTTNKFDYIQSPVGDYIRNRSPCHDNFKVPLKPPKTKMAIPTSPLVPTQQFKNIISPIGIYIKNSPGVCLKQNFPVKTVPLLKPPRRVELFKDKENNSATLPEVVYKPGKKVTMSVYKDIMLPKSIKKMVNEPTITKHECRVGGNSNKRFVSKKLLDENLTSIGDSSVLHQSEQDISFVNQKQAFIK